MLRVGVTGGIGSGKSSVCSIFARLGVPVYDADSRSKFLISSLPELREALVFAFGEKAFENGVYNRAYMSALVFSDPAQLSKLNSIVHPFVFRDWEAFCGQHSDCRYLIKEAAIMLETESRNTVDRIVLVYSPEELRIQRVVKRDKADPEAVRARIASQMPEEQKRRLADYVVVNDGSQSLIEQVLALHKLFTAD